MTFLNKIKFLFSIELKGSNDPRWIGAWWLGFIGCAIAAIINAFPILMFAYELPEAKRHRLKDSKLI